jgi:hypothetical protein
MNGQIGKEGNEMEMWGYSLPFWESVFRWSATIAFVFGGIGVTAAFVSAIVGYQVTDRVVKESDKKIAEANARSEEAKAISVEASAKIAEAHTQAAKANERSASLEHDAAQARLETERLKAQLAWRILPQNLANALGTFLSTNTGQINIQYVANDTEAQYFAIQLINIFRKAGWQVAMMSVTKPGTVIFGIFVPDAQSPSTQIIRNALGSVGIRFSTQALPTSDTIMSSGGNISGAPILFIGSKPISQ